MKLVRGQPLGIWMICVFLLAGALIASGMSVDSGFELEVTAVAFVLAGLFIVGLLMKIRWLYVFLLLFLSLALFLQVVATLLIVSAVVAGGDYDWPLLIGRYWAGVVVLVALISSITYLGKRETRSYLFTERYKSKQRPY